MKRLLFTAGALAVLAASGGAVMAQKANADVNVQASNQQGSASVGADVSKENSQSQPIKEQKEGTQANSPEAKLAVEAALAQTGGVKANAVERDSENGATWEVEITKSDGSTVDARLDANYHLIVAEPDTEAK